MKLKNMFGAVALATTALFATTAAYSATIIINPLPGDGPQTNPVAQLQLDWTALSTYASTGTVQSGDFVVDTVVRDYSFGSVNVDNYYGNIGLIPGTATVGNSYGSLWGLYFDYTLFGQVIEANGSSILANYTSGFIDIYYDDFGGRTAADAARDIAVDPRVMRIEVTGSGGDIANFLLFGNVQSVADDMFFFEAGSDFADLVANGIVINSRIDTNLDTNEVPSGPDGALTRESTLNGSGAFEVPEPGMLALLGLGLIGIGAIRRNKKSA